MSSVRMMTSSNGNIFRVTGHLCGEFTVPGEVPAQRPVTRNFDVFFYLRLNKRLSKQSCGWWFETLSRPLRRHCNGFISVSEQGLSQWEKTLYMHGMLHATCTSIATYPKQVDGYTETGNAYCLWPFRSMAFTDWTVVNVVVDTNLISLPCAMWALYRKMSPDATVM